MILPRKYGLGPHNIGYPFSKLHLVKNCPPITTILISPWLQTEASLPYAMRTFWNDWGNENKFRANEISSNLNLRGVSGGCQWAISPVSISPPPVVRHSILGWARATHWWRTYRVSPQRRCLSYMLTHLRTAPRFANPQSGLWSEWTRNIVRSREVVRPPVPPFTNMV